MVAVMVEVVKVVTFFRVLGVVRVVRWNQDGGGGTYNCRKLEKVDGRSQAFLGAFLPHVQGYPVNPHVQRV